MPATRGGPHVTRLHSRKYSRGLMWCNFTSRVTRSSPTVSACYTRICGSATHTHARSTASSPYTGSIRNLNLPLENRPRLDIKAIFFFFQRWESNTPARNLPSSSLYFFFSWSRFNKGYTERARIVVPWIFIAIPTHLSTIVSIYVRACVCLFHSKTGRGYYLLVSREGRTCSLSSERGGFLSIWRKKRKRKIDLRPECLVSPNIYFRVSGIPTRYTIIVARLSIWKGLERSYSRIRSWWIWKRSA